MQYFLSHKLIHGDCDFNQIQVGQTLGNGNSMVFSVTFQNKPAAMKQIIIKNEEQAKRVQNEIMMMKTLSQFSQSIIKYYGSFRTVRELGRYNMSEMAYIVMEKAVMSLERLIQHRSRSEEMFSEGEILSIMKVLINTLYVLQKQGIAHCDIKPENILVMNVETLEVKLCDIGSCRMTVQSTEQATLVGTVPFLAPELVKNYSKQKVVNNPFKSDVFSLGLCFVYLLLFKKFKSNERLKINQNIYRQIVSEWVIEAKELYFRNEVICVLLDQLLNFNEKTRVNFIQLNDIFNKVSLEYGMKNSKILKQAKRKHQQMFLQKVKKPTNRNAYYSVCEETKYATGSEVFRKTTSFAIKINSFQSPTISTKFRKRIVVPKKQEQRSTPNLSNLNIAVSPLLSKRRKSITASFSLQTNTSTVLSDDSPKLNSKAVQKSQYMIEIEKYKVVLVNQDVLGQIGQFQTDWVDKLVIFESCYQNLFNPKQLTLRITSQENLSTILNQFKQKQNLTSLVVDMRYFIQNQNSILLASVNTKSINTLSLLLDNSQISSFNKFFLMWISEGIKKLNISLKRSEIKPGDVCEMISWISECLQLQFLNLNLQQLKLNQKQNQSIIQILAKSKKLKNLKINLSHNSISYSKEHPWQLPKILEKLSLQYSYNNLRSVLNNISLSLTGVKNSLKQLVLKLQDTALSSKEVNFLFNCLTKLQLETLCLRLGYNHLDDSVSKYISKNLPLLQTITHLDIGFQSTNITPQGLISIIMVIDKMMTLKKLKFVSISYNRYSDREIILQQFSDVIKSQSKTSVVFESSVVRFYILMKPAVLQTRSIKKVGFKKTLETYCENFHLTGESFKHFSCLTCFQKNPIHKNIFFCQFCSQSCDYNHHTIVPTFENVSCGCTHLKCKSDINRLFCSRKQGYVIQKESKCLFCQKNNLCLSCVQTCKKNHIEMVVDNEFIGKFRCCQNKEVL